MSDPRIMWYDGVPLDVDLVLEGLQRIYLRDAKAMMSPLSANDPEAFGRLTSEDRQDGGEE